MEFKQQYVCSECGWRSPPVQGNLSKEVAEMAEEAFRAKPPYAHCPECKGELKQDITKGE